MARVATSLKPNGVFALGLRHGPAGAGTYYFPANAAETVALAAGVNLAVELRLESQPSALPNKAHVTWTRLVFRKEPPSDEPLRLPAAGFGQSGCFSPARIMYDCRRPQPRQSVLRPEPER